MKKLLVVLFTLLCLVGCGSGETNSDTTIKVSTTAEPHATILEFSKPLLEEKGYDL